MIEDHSVKSSGFDSRGTHFSDFPGALDAVLSDILDRREANGE